LIPRGRGPTFRASCGGRACWRGSSALAALWSAEYRPFVFPNNDFYSFRRAAWSFEAGELPRSLKRGPILPGVMAALAPAIPGTKRELHAALLANLVFSLVLFAALWRFAARTWPAAAPSFGVLLATTPVLHTMALQPLVEPSLGCFVALAFLGLRARSPWQYAAAGAAALSRPEAATLLAVLAAANALAEGRWQRHLALAALAAVPFLAWNALGALGGSGPATYLALREGFGTSAPLYLAMLPKELFFGWWGQGALALLVFAGVVIAPWGFGAWHGFRTAPREAGAMLAWLALSCAVVVLYGVGKARYLHPVAWVPLLCFAIGIAELAPRGARALSEHAAPGARRALCGIAGALALGALLWRGALLARSEPALGLVPDLVFAALAVLCLAGTCAALASGRGAAGVAAALLAFAASAPIALGGVQRKGELLGAIHDFDYPAWPAAEWLRDHLAPGERAAVLPYSQVKFAADLPAERVISFRRFEAESLAELRAEMERRGVTHAVYTWRRPPESEAERFYARRRKEHLAALFASGAPLPGFVHVATLPAPARPTYPPTQIYRLAPP
jgi:hypothetical protein